MMHDFLRCYCVKCCMIWYHIIYHALILYDDVMKHGIIFDIILYPGSPYFAITKFTLFSPGDLSKREWDWRVRFGGRSSCPG